MVVSSGEVPVHIAIATASRKAAGLTAAVALSLAALFAGAPISIADPYDGDDGGSSADSGGGVSDPSGGMGQEAPDQGGGQEAPGDVGGGQDAPDHGSGTPGSPVDAGPDAPVPGGGPETPDSGGATQEGGGEGGGTQPSGDDGTTPEGGAPSQPTELDAPAPDVETAESSTTTEVSTSTSTQEVTTYQESLSTAVSTSTLSTAMTLSSPVVAWNSSWLSYDRYYRPIFTNPYRSPLQVIYDYGGGTQTFTVPPLQRAVIDVPNAGVYSFTAATKPASGPPTNVSVGSFSGGGYQPAPGQAPPQKPQKLNTTKNALVQITFDRGTSEPFRVSSLTDLGKDPTVNNSTKVLLDEEIPAWGDWSKTAQGEPLFVIKMTQLLPGVSRPSQEPLPGYNVKLAASQRPLKSAANRTIFIASAVGVVALVVVGVLIVVPRRRRSAGK